MGNSGSSDAKLPVTRKSTERGKSEVQNINFAVSGMQGMRHTMEDHHILCTSLHVKGCTNLDDHSLFAVFDGHGGDFTSAYLKDNMLKVLAGQEELAKYHSLPRTGMKSRSDVTGIQLLRQALVKTFIQLDQDLIPLQKKRNQDILSGKIKASSSLTYDEEDEIKVKPSVVGERSGSTAVVVVLTPSHYLCANAGDSRAALRRSGAVLPLSFDHKPSDVPERYRVQQAKGVVKGKRVDGDLAVSRAFGDFAFKQDKQLPVEKQKVIVIPDFVLYPRKELDDEFIVIGCDGIWDVASNKQCTEFVQTLLSEGEVDLGNVCEEVLDTCLDRKSRDNMTLMLIGLPGLKADRSGSAIVNNAIWGHRTARTARVFTTVTGDVTHKACLAVGSECISMEKAICTSQ